MSAAVEVSRIADVLVSSPTETGQVVGDAAWFCSFDVPGILLDFDGEFRVAVSRETALTLGRTLIAAARDD